MRATRRQLRKNAQTRRRRRQAGGGEVEDFEIIRLIHTEVNDPGAMIGMLYKTKEIYDSCPAFPPASPMGGPRARDIAIPEPFARPKSGMKPLNSMLRCAFNFFFKYANRSRGSNDEAKELGMAEAICAKLTEVFWIFVNANPELAPSRGQREKADKLFRRIGHFIGALSVSAAAEEENTRERLARAKAAQEREAAYAKSARERNAAAAANANRMAREAAKTRATNYWQNWAVAERSMLNEMRREGAMSHAHEEKAHGNVMMDPHFM